MAAADLNTIRATIEGRLATELASSPAIPVVFQNMPFEPTPNSSFVQCLTTFGSSEYLGHGSTSNSYNRIVGLVVLNIFSAQGVGPGANYVIGKRIRDLYNRVIVSGVFFDAPIKGRKCASFLGKRHWLHQHPRAIFKHRSV